MASTSRSPRPRPLARAGRDAHNTSKRAVPSLRMILICVGVLAIALPRALADPAAAVAADVPHPQLKLRGFGSEHGIRRGF